MSAKIKALKKKLDILVQQVYVALNPFCLVCGAPTNCMHHYIPKSQSLWLRWDNRNLIPICSHCHCLHHQSGDPRIHQEIIRKKGHKWADMLEAERRIILKVNMANLQVVYDELMEVLHEI